MQQTKEDVDLYSYPGISNIDQLTSGTKLSSSSQDNATINLDINDDEFTIKPSGSGDFLEGQLSSGAPAQTTRRRLSDNLNRLDEPILDTLLRDLYGIYSKMKIITLPLSSYDIYKVVLKGWDLWGPLLLCTFLAFNLHHSEDRDIHLGPHFSDVFVLVWFGSCVVSINYRLLSLASIKNRTISSQLNRLNSQQDISNISDISHSSKGDMMSNMQSTNITLSHKDNPYQTLLSPPSMFQLMCVFGYCLVAPCFGLILLKIFSLESLFFERMIIGLIFGFAWPTFCSVRILIRYQEPDKRALAIYPIGLFYFVLSCMIILNH